VIERSDDRVSHPGGHCRQCMAASLLTPNALRCSTLSSLRGKRVKNKLSNTFFTDFSREGDRAQR